MGNYKKLVLVERQKTFPFLHSLFFFLNISKKLAGTGGIVKKTVKFRKSIFDSIEGSRNNT